MQLFSHTNDARRISILIALLSRLSGFLISLDFINVRVSLITFFARSISRQNRNSMFASLILKVSTDSRVHSNKTLISSTCRLLVKSLNKTLSNYSLTSLCTSSKRLGASFKASTLWIPLDVASTAEQSAMILAVRERGSIMPTTSGNQVQTNPHIMHNVLTMFGCLLASNCAASFRYLHQVSCCAALYSICDHTHINIRESLS